MKAYIIENCLCNFIAVISVAQEILPKSDYGTLDVAIRIQFYERVQYYVRKMLIMSIRLGMVTHKN